MGPGGMMMGPHGGDGRTEWARMAIIPATRRRLIADALQAARARLSVAARTIERDDGRRRERRSGCRVVRGRRMTQADEVESRPRPRAPFGNLAMSQSVHVARYGALYQVTLDRPSANAIDAATSRALFVAFRAFNDDPDARVAILTGAGDRFFSAGWDFRAAAAGEGAEASDSDHGPGGFAGLTDIFALEKPVIAAVNGLAIGGGFELALACDLIVAAENAEFALPEAGLGLVADAGGVQRLARRIAPIWPWNCC